MTKEVQQHQPEQRDLANQLLGRIQMAEGFAKLATVSSLRNLQIVKESKLYKGLPRTTASGKVETVSTFDEFCGLLGVSARHVNEQLQNLQLIGEDALEAMSRIGLGYRDLRKLRKLDNEDRQAVIESVGEEINAGDKEAVVILIDDLAAKHAKEKAELKQQVDDAKADQDATEKLVAKKNEKIDALSQQLEGRSNEIASEHAERCQKDLQDAAMKADSSVREVTYAIEMAFDSHEEPSYYIRWLASQTVIALEKQLEAARRTYALENSETAPNRPEDWGITDIPWWTRDLYTEEQYRAINAGTKPEIEA